MKDATYYIEMAVKSKVDKVKEQLAKMPKEIGPDNNWFDDIGLKGTDYIPLHKSIETDKFITLNALRKLITKAGDSGESERGKYSSMDAIDILPLMVWNAVGGTRGGEFTPLNGDKKQLADYGNIMNYYRDN